MWYTNAQRVVLYDSSTKREDEQITIQIEGALLSIRRRPSSSLSCMLYVLVWEKKKKIIMNRAGGALHELRKNRVWKMASFLDGNVFLHDDDENEFVLTDPVSMQPLHNVTRGYPKGQPI